MHDARCCERFLAEPVLSEVEVLGMTRIREVFVRTSQMPEISELLDLRRCLLYKDWGYGEGVDMSESKTECGCPFCKLIESVDKAIHSEKARGIQKKTLLKLRDFIDDRLAKMDPKS